MYSKQVILIAKSKKYGSGEFSQLLKYVNNIFDKKKLQQLFIFDSLDFKIYKSDEFFSNNNNKNKRVNFLKNFISIIIDYIFCWVNYKRYTIYYCSFTPLWNPLIFILPSCIILGPITGSDPFIRFYQKQYLKYFIIKILYKISIFFIKFRIHSQNHTKYIASNPYILNYFKLLNIPSHDIHAIRMNFLIESTRTNNIYKKKEFDICFYVRSGLVKRNEILIDVIKLCVSNELSCLTFGEILQGLESRYVIQMGEISSSNVYNLMQKSYLFYSSTLESGGIVFYEAYSNGCIIIGSSLSALKFLKSEVSDHHSIHLIDESNNAHFLEKSIEYILWKKNCRSGR